MTFTKRDLCTINMALIEYLNKLDDELKNKKLSPEGRQLRLGCYINARETKHVVDAYLKDLENEKSK